MKFNIVENADPTYNINEDIKDYTNTDLTVDKSNFTLTSANIPDGDLF